MFKILVSLAVLTSIATSTAVGHHSPAVFDRTREIKLMGSIKEFRWSNPHSWIELNVRNDNGGVDVWSVEMNGPSFLVKAGWKASTLKAGDEVVILANPLRTDEKVGKFVSITLPDGRVLTERPLSQP